VNFGLARPLFLIDLKKKFEPAYFISLENFYVIINLQRLIRKKLMNGRYKNVITLFVIVWRQINLFLLDLLFIRRSMNYFESIPIVSKNKISYSPRYWCRHGINLTKTDDFNFE